MDKVKFWNIVDGNEEAELYLYGEIANETWWGDEVTPKQFIEDISAYKDKDLSVRINSGGGDVFAAQAIHSVIKSHPKNVTVHVDGMCASAATIIACAGDKVIMPKNAIYMIHNPMVSLWGAYNTDELAKMANVLETVKQTIVNVYQDKVGKDNIDDIVSMMDEESWLTAEEAKNLGLVDEIEDNAEIDTALNKGVLIVNNVRCQITNEAKFKAMFNEKEFQMKNGEKKNSENILDQIKTLLGITTEQPTNKADEATEKERTRLQALDALKTGDEIIDSLVESAKTNGKSVEDTKIFVDAVAEKTKEYQEKINAVKMITDLIQDNMNSGSDEIKPGVKNDVNEKKKALDDFINVANNARGGK